MAEQTIVTTRVDGLRPLGAAGQRSFEFIVGVVEKALGERHGRFFGQPATAPGGEGVDWLTIADGTPQRLTDLKREEADRAKAAVNELQADIHELADRFEVGGDEASQRVAIALRNALEVPNESCIYMVGNQPVIVQWAHRLDRSHAPKGVLSQLVPRPAQSDPQLEPTPVLAPALPTRERNSWLWQLGWLLLAIITAIVLYLALTACGLRGFTAWNNCPVPVNASALVLADERQDELEREIRNLERDVAEAQVGCQPIETVEAPPVEEELDEIEERCEERGCETGELNVQLSWNDTSDIDLYVTCPNRQTISYETPRACGATLDVDSNATGVIRTPVENIYWASDPPRGPYRILVKLFKARQGLGPYPFRVKVTVGEHVEEFTGSVSARNPSKTFNFTY